MASTNRVQAFVLAGLIASVSLASPMATSAQDAERPEFRRFATDGNNPTLRRESAGADDLVRVIVGLSKPSVAARRGDAAAVGAQLSPGTEAAVRTSIDTQQGSVEDAVARLGGTVEAGMADAVNALVVSVPRRSVGRLSLIAGVSQVQPVRTVTRSNSVANATTGVDAVWEELGFTGDGQVIAIIDDGIDYTHATFGGSGDPADYLANDPLTIDSDFPTAKVIGGYDYVGDTYDADVEGSVPAPDPDPLACGEHGTHVAGTAAGAGVAADGSTFAGPYTAAAVADLKVGPGSAPAANLLAYKVFGCLGSTDDSTILLAVDQAVADGADVINLSLGSPWGSGTGIDVIALNDAVRAGVMVVAAAGNEGGAPYMVGAPGSANRALSVAALDASLATFPGAGFLPDGPNGINANSADLSAPITGPVRVLMTGDAIALGCDAADYASVVAGEIVVTVRGTCARTDRAILGQAAGAAAVVMLNNDVGPSPFEGPIAGVTIPFVGMPGETEEALVALDGTTATLGESEPIPNPTFGQATSFSSGGPRSGDSALKPEIIAPGESIASALVGSGTDSVRLSGTSMASPHTAGIAALVRQAHPAWSPERVKAAMMSSSDRSVSGYNPLIYGAGLVDAGAAISTTTSILTTNGLMSLSFGYSQSEGAISVTRPMRIFNDNPFPVTFDLSSEFSGDPLGAVISMPASVTVAKRRFVDVPVTISLDAAASAALPPAEASIAGLAAISGVVVATPTTPDADGAHIPFALVPRGLSDISVVPSAGKLAVHNDGGHIGSADVYAWGLVGSPGVADPFDLRTGGIQQLPGDVLGGDPADAALIFAVATTRRFSNPAQAEVDVLIDTDDDPDPEFLVVSIDNGLAFAGEPDGIAVTLTVDLASGLIVGEPFLTNAPMNSSVMLLPTLASWIGAETFSYSVEIYDQLSGGFDASANSARWDTANPPVATGGFEILEPGASTDIAVTKNKMSSAYASTKGWLVVSFDDASTVVQATTIPKSRA